ncbi:mannitol dehydrogenase family protein [Caldicellulosiruptoraceae bacterium PP1]
MLILNRENIEKNKAKWQEKGFKLPEFDYKAMQEYSIKNPEWVHFGAGNIFRGFVAMLQQSLLEQGKSNSGIIAAESFDYEIIEKIYKPYDNLSILVIANSDGKLEKSIVSSISESLVADIENSSYWNRLIEIFKKPSLKIVSFTITEKGYNLYNIDGEFLPIVSWDITNGPSSVKTAMGKVAALLYERYKSGEFPISLLSLDNCSHNGQKLYTAVSTIVKEWVDKGFVESGFYDYISNPQKVSFPWSMIDKIVPRPSEQVKQNLINDGIGNMDIICTNKNTYIAPFINAEKAQYLVIEDTFANGRPPLELAGVYFTDRETVENVERMKVQTCLNPLHTALAIFGCLLGYKLIADEMKDKSLKGLIEKIGYEEGMRTCVDPKIISPLAFVKEVIEERLPNPFIPDTPQRIATDTSQKMPIRFGETIKAYCIREDLNVADLEYIPLVIAGWCRYLMGLDDNWNEFQLSSDPLLDELKKYISKIEIGNIKSIKDNLKPILSNPQLFGVNLYEVGLGSKVEKYFKEMISEIGSVRKTLDKYINI